MAEETQKPNQAVTAQTSAPTTAQAAPVLATPAATGAPVAPSTKEEKPKSSGGFFGKWKARVAENKAKGEAAKVAKQGGSAEVTPAKPGEPGKTAAGPKFTIENPAKDDEGKPDYSKLSPEDKKRVVEAEKLFNQGMATIRDLIAPSSMEVAYDHIMLDGMYSQSFFVYTYPRYIETNWLSPIINFDVTLDLAQFIYPIASDKIMKVLKGQVARFQSSIRMAQEKGQVRDPALETALEDAESLRTELQRGQEKFFQFALYITVYHPDIKKLDKVTKQLESLLGGKLVLTRRADLRMEHALTSTLPLALDELEVNHNMNTSPLSSTFPFISADLTSNEGILYGLNRHNDSLIIFDRFSLENANSVVFAKSGAGKSYAVKLEILRYLMWGADVIVIDPENEYEALSQTVGGTYLNVSLNSDRRINPFDLPKPLNEESLKPGDLLRSAIIDLTGLLKLMLGAITAEQEGLIDKALIDTYATRGITMEVVDPSQFEMPTMNDFYSVLSSMEGTTDLASRVQKYTTGTFSGIFNQQTNVTLDNKLIVFSIRDLEDSLRPIAMYIILNYIWNRVRSELKRRILTIDEAWTMMQHEDSAKFLFGLVKRARKYYLGVTTITQDVEDFVRSPYGKPIVSNSSMQLLLKQSPSVIDGLQKVFNLTEGEKYMLLNSGVGQGLFFAGLKHVAIQIIASYTEDKIVTTNPEQILKQQSEQALSFGETQFTQTPEAPVAPAPEPAPQPAAPVPAAAQTYAEPATQAYAEQEAPAVTVTPVYAEPAAPVSAVGVEPTIAVEPITPVVAPVTGPVGAEPMVPVAVEPVAQVAPVVPVAEAAATIAPQLIEPVAVTPAVAESVAPTAPAPTTAQVIQSQAAFAESLVSPQAPVAVAPVAESVVAVAPVASASAAPAPVGQAVEPAPVAVSQSTAAEEPVYT